jgi:hypothetical protein
MGRSLLPYFAIAPKRNGVALYPAPPQRTKDDPGTGVLGERLRY